MLKNFLVHCLMAALLAVSQLSISGYARNLPAADSKEASRQPASYPIDTAIAVGSTRVSYNSSSTEMKPESTMLVARTATEGDTAPAVTHIRRKKRELRVDPPYDFHTTHLFCELDQRGRHHIIWFYPNHCIWIWNNKYVHEGFYRVFKLYQLEAFLFGQYSDRMNKLEFEKYFFVRP
ncbi:uncharacterized protein LOC111077273 [Drosophila obscura]|uniref:uncharacterized protein LOC111077273 n=1 Tax=Drosophila obscura TaxID=7282 RepID=UPI001BB15ED1|nr:uncharacterized protein LOC111077273 [Drosophila obscura]